MDKASRIRRSKFRAWHRGTREADFLIGGFFDFHHQAWGEFELAWFEALLEEEDVEIMAWALGTHDAPARYCGPLMDALKRLDYVEIPR